MKGAGFRSENQLIGAGIERCGDLFRLRAENFPIHDGAQGAAPIPDNEG